MQVLCYSVRLVDLYPYSDKAFKAVDYSGMKEFIPKSQVFGRDEDVKKSDAYWISEWILEQKKLQYSKKKCAWFDKDTRKLEESYGTSGPVGESIKKHVPKHIEAIKSEPAKELLR